MPRIFVTAGSGNSYKGALVARQAGLTCAWTFVDVLGGETRRAPFLNVNPLGKVPYLLLPDGTGFGESNAIAWFLAEGTDLMPHSAASRARAIQWMIFEQTHLEPFISPARFFTTVAPAQRAEREGEFPRWLENGSLGLRVLDAHLRTQDFVVADRYSVADVAVFGYVHLAAEGGFCLQDYPSVSRWISRVEAQRGYVPIHELLSSLARAHA
jgi:glutathione S-transferase